MKRLIVEFALRPRRHISDHVALSDVRPVCARPVCRLWKLVFEINIAADTNEENSSTILSDTKIPRVENRPPYSVTSQTITIDLIQKKTVIITKSHPVHVLDYERLRSDCAQHAIKVPIKIIGVRIPIAAAGLAVRLAWITTYQELCVWESIKLRYISDLNVRIFDIRFIDLRCYGPDIVCPNDIIARSLKCIVRTATTAEKRNGWNS